MTTGETGFRNVAARVIVEEQGALVLQRTAEGYQFTGLFEKTSIVCKTWPEAERVLIRLHVPPQKIIDIRKMIDAGEEVIMRRQAQAQS
ncbi:hypothetical protein [Edaphobacter flagellatus]|uniref:hypothetical protein n=1 Tax=Edaphobacter flagellatus TaxID=1933044 RepID=UPI0021B43C5C|nr:hypothetical protein [Edaphobacter flagellatus]